MKNKCWFKSVTIKDPLPNTVVFNTMFNGTFFIHSLRPFLNDIDTCRFLAQPCRKFSVRSAFYSSMKCLSVAITQSCSCPGYLAIKCNSGPSLCSLDLQSNWPTKLQSLHSGESLSFEPNQQKCSAAPDCCLIGY